MDQSTITIRLNKRWLRVAVLVAVTAAVAFPVGVMAGDRFADVPVTNVFHKNINALADSGVTKGCNPPDNTLYCPSDVVTREQMAAFLDRLGALSGQAPSVNAKTALTAEEAETAMSANTATTATTASSADTADDADLLDGFDSTDFLMSGDPIDATTLDGFDSTDFLMSADPVDADTLDGIDSLGFVQQNEADAIDGAMVAANSLDATDIVDVPGVAQGHRTTPLAITAASPAVESAKAINIDVPAAGFVIVTASAQLKATAAGTHLTMDVSTSGTALPDAGNTKNFVIPGTASAGDWVIIGTVTRVFSVGGAGTVTYHTVVNEVSGSGEIDDLTMTAIYVPVTYGGISQ